VSFVILLGGLMASTQWRRAISIYYWSTTRELDQIIRIVEARALDFEAYRLNADPPAFAQFMVWDAAYPDLMQEGVPFSFLMVIDETPFVDLAPVRLEALLNQEPSLEAIARQVDDLSRRLHRITDQQLTDICLGYSYATGLAVSGEGRRQFIHNLRVVINSR